MKNKHPLIIVKLLSGNRKAILKEMVIVQHSNFFNIETDLEGFEQRQ